MRKNILLIGGSYGIGKAIAENLAKKNDVIIASRTLPEINLNNIKHIPFDATKDDITSKELPEQLDGFVYCPGSIQLRPFKNLKIETFEEDFQINFISMVITLKGILPNLLKSENPSIVIFSSVAVKIGMPFHSSISASKGAIEGFAKAFAAEYAPKIRCNVIAPSLTDTPLAERFLNDEKKKENASERHPLKRIGETKDIANMVSFLISKKASWITGQVYGVDGGLSTLKI
ncbi:MAG: oxidoreductase [Bacteroidetes bacterium HGW-Bacteroidetes-2]|jgi:NAD(P)-dependent dehydrogenase (short-subunit alcohol dehydrogenase family)|nr:MAG: oxidoreductase [Bacteroidetes bacterium HGW-Bacteroidetes-2]